jgi:hypothetical protein
VHDLKVNLDDVIRVDNDTTMAGGAAEPRGGWRV